MSAVRSVPLPGLFLAVLGAAFACSSPGEVVRPPAPSSSAAERAPEPRRQDAVDIPPRGPALTTERAPRRYEAVALSEVLARIAREGGVDIDFHSSSDPAVTYVGADSLSWEELLEEVVESTTFRLRKRSRRLYTVRPTAVVTAEFLDQDIRQVLLAIARLGETSVVISEKVHGRVSLNLSGVPVRKAIETIAKTAGYVAIQTSTGWKIGTSDGL